MFIGKKSSAENYLLSCLTLYFFTKHKSFGLIVLKYIYIFNLQWYKLSEIDRSVLDLHPGKLKAEFGSLCLYICTHLFLKSFIMELLINNIFETVSSDVLTTQICWSSSFWEHSTLFGLLALLLGIVSLCFNAALVQLCLSWISAARAGTSRKVVRFKYAKCFYFSPSPKCGSLCAESVHVLKFHFNFCPFLIGCICQHIRS